MTHRKALGGGFGGAEFAKPAHKGSGLGRGLSALLGERDAEAAQQPSGEDHGRSPRVLPIEQLKANPFQPRQNFDASELDDLTNSIREKGILQPLVVRPHPGRPGEYQIIAGERRWRAAQKARLHEVPVLVREFSDAEALEIAIIENVQRADLNAVEEARGYKQLQEQFGYAQEKLAQLIGKSRSHIANTLRLLNLPKGVIDMIVGGQLSAGHARSLINAPDPERLAREIVAGGLNVRAAEKKAQHAKGAGPPRPAHKDADTRALEAKISSQLGLAVAIDDQGSKGGTVTIKYGNLEQLDDVCARLGRSGGI
jgi:ParB family chromosome partitioning protein